MKKKLSTLQLDVFDLIIILALLIIAAVPRLYLLDQIPSGLHGDEAWTGLDARMIVEHGSIEPYTGHALGQPTGPMYVTALLFKLFGESIYTLRVSMALFGILTPALFYILMRLFVSRTTSLFASLLFSFSLFHLHFSRLAFMLISAPVFQIAALIFLFLGRRSKRTIYYILAGVVSGLGLHTYNAFVIFPPTIMALLAWDVIKSRTWQAVIHSLLYLLCFVVFASPLLNLMIRERDAYFMHHKGFAVVLKDNYKQTQDPQKKALLLLENGNIKARAFLFGNEKDGADAFGQTYSFNYIILALAVIGSIYVLTRRREQEYFMLISFVFMLSSTYLTVSGTYRRQILTLVYLFFLSGMGLFLIQNTLNKLTKQKPVTAILFVGISSILVLAIAYQSLSFYFSTFAYSESTNFSMTRDLTQAILKQIQIAHEDEQVYIISRWHYNYETIRFLAPSMKIADWEEALLENAYEHEHITFILTLGYLDQLEIISEHFPNGTRYELKDHENKTYAVLYQAEHEGSLK